MRIVVIAVLVLTTLGSAAAEPPLNTHQRVLHFLNRAGYGARPSEVAAVETLGLFAYVQQQLHPETIDDRVAEAKLKSIRSLRVPSVELVRRYPDAGTIDKMKKEHPDVAPTWYGDSNQLLAEMQEQRVFRAVYTRRHLQEVVVDFWLNHFNVFFYKGPEKWLLLPFEREVVRPRALGRFRDLLGAVAHSPAMLLYLDNAVSRVEVPAKKPGAPKSGGLNENYARELLELHTLGVDGGYTQHDVVEVARCFTGWTVKKDGDVYSFVFRPEWHDKGEKKVLGVTIAAGGGIDDGERVLDILAAHPSTARFLARKLCREFIADDPPQAAIDQVARSYTRSDGDMRLVLGTLFNTSQFWSQAAWRSKIKTPFHLVVSAVRALDGDVQNTKAVQQWLRQMGMGLYLCDPPTGYIDRAEKWLSPGGLLDRLNFCVALVRNQINGVKVNVDRLTAASKRTPEELAQRLVLDGEISASTRSTLMASMSAAKPDYAQLVGLLLGSPEFQHR